MRKPIILITAEKQIWPAGRDEMPLPMTGCTLNYVESILRSGGAPVLLPRIDDKAAVRSIAAIADGIMLTGGGDVGSLIYGEEPHPAGACQDPIRDEMEIEITRLALENKIPILAICRGQQLLNVALGGTLFQDIPTQVPNALQHSIHGLDVYLGHTVEIESGSLLADIFKTTSLAVNSHHHQAVKELGKGLRVSCRARDGVIEGIESNEGNPILGVQFHPEDCSAIYPQFQTLFDWLIRQAGAVN